MKSERIKTLESLRAIAFILVFLSHTGIKAFEGIGMWSVSLFFVLSGFVSVAGQYNNELETSFRERFKYMLKKIWRLYPLCFVTNLAMIPFELIGIKKTSFNYIIKKFFINVSLFYEVLPISNTYQLNSPAWFMGTMILFYFCFPIVLKLIKNKRKKEIIINSLFLIAIEICIALIGRRMPIVSFKSKMFKSHIYQWFVYSFPFSRVIDVILGCNLGYMYVLNKGNVINSATKKELIASILSILSIVYAHYDTFYWDIVIVCLPSVLLLIYYFAYGQGKISQIIVNDVFMYIARISAYGFLIHWVVFRYLESATVILFGLDRNFFGYINMTIGFVLTLLCCEVWNKVQKLLNSRIKINQIYW